MVNPKVDAETKKIVRRLTKDAELYGCGEKHAGHGKYMFRSVLVPPVALSLSLFFGLFNLAMLAFSIFSIVFSHKSWLPVLRVSFATASIAAILVLPFIMSGNEIANSDSYAYLFEKAEGDSGAVAYAFE